ncbi:MAG TPA: hypothetical protein VE442_04700 [Jatrophihabitans sp.]|jgi:hypothetical protein|nr:hypothetical protein [Jatrophihabitans sp.]
MTIVAWPTDPLTGVVAPRRGRHRLTQLSIFVATAVMLASCTSSRTTPRPTFSATGDSGCEIIYHVAHSQTAMNVTTSTTGKLTIDAMDTDGNTFHKVLELRSAGLVQLTAPLADIKSLRGSLAVSDGRTLHCAVQPA